MLICLVAGFCASSSWALGGTGPRRLISNPARVEAKNVVLSPLLVASFLRIAIELSIE